VSEHARNVEVAYDELGAAFGEWAAQIKDETLGR
jgi:microcompartment protein CcmK/EutM